MTNTNLEQEKSFIEDAAEHNKIDLEQSVADTGVVAHQPDQDLSEAVQNEHIEASGASALAHPPAGPKVELTEKAKNDNVSELISRPEPNRIYGPLDPRRYVHMIRGRVKNAA